MDFNYSPSESYSLPSWQDSFSAPSVAPSFASTSYNFSPTSFNAYDYVSSYQPRPASSNWMDTLTTVGRGLAATGDVIRQIKGELPPGYDPLEPLTGPERRKEEQKYLASVLRDAFSSSSTDPVEEVLDPAAERRRNPRAFGQLPSLSNTFSGFRLAGFPFG